jgi:hypothetical protein
MFVITVSFNDPRFGIFENLFIQGATRVGGSDQQSLGSLFQGVHKECSASWTTPGRTCSLCSKTVSYLRKLSPEERGALLIDASWKSAVGLVRVIALSGPISENHCCRALAAACERNDERVARVISKNCPISSTSRGYLVDLAVSYDEEAIVQVLLEDGPIPIIPRIVAAYCASRNENLNLASLLMGWDTQLRAHSHFLGRKKIHHRDTENKEIAQR